jgi:hypothetical protein
MERIGKRLFVLVTEIGGTRQECAIFEDEGEAGAAYLDAHLECLDGRSGIFGDPASVTDCRLYETPTANEDEARRLAVNRDAKLLNQFEPPDEE